MSDIFLKLLNMSFAASWLIVAVIVLRLIERKTPRWIICLLWGLVAIRLLCPFSIECSFSIIPLDEVIPKSVLSEPYHKLNITAGVESIDEYIGDTNHEGISVTYGYRNILMSKPGAIWICGVFGLLLYVVIMNLRLRGHLTEAILLRENIYLCDYVCSPFTFGFFCPHIYLPSGMDESDIEYVIAHEKAHVQRKDHVWKIIAFLILAIYWFNPLSWVAFILFCRDIELACDEKVIKNLSVAKKKAYLEALLSCSLKKRTAIVYPLAFGEVGVKQRVKSILRYKKPTFVTIFFSFLVFIVIGICFLTTSPQKYQTDASSTQIQIHEKQNELEQILLDYNKENIVKASVFLKEFDNVVTSANVFIVNKEKIADVDEQDMIKAFVSEYLNLDTQSIYLEYAVSEAFPYIR